MTQAESICYKEQGLFFALIKLIIEAFSYIIHADRSGQVGFEMTTP